MIVMADFHLEIVTMDGVAFSGQAQKIIVRTTEGDVGILARHTDFVSPLGVGVAKITIDGKTRNAACSGGFVSVKNHEAVIVATTFEWADMIDKDRAERAKQEAERRISLKGSERENAAAEMKLRRALNRLRAADSK